MKTSATRTPFALSALFGLACLGMSAWLWPTAELVNAQSEQSQLPGQEIAETQGKFPVDQLAVKTTPSLIPDQTITELSVDDGIPESAVGASGGGTITGVNRLTPTSYPSTLIAVSLYAEPRAPEPPDARR